MSSRVKAMELELQQCKGNYETLKEESQSQINKLTKGNESLELQNAELVGKDDILINTSKVQFFQKQS